MEQSKVLTNRQKQAMESRRRLLDAATQLFNEHGFRETSVQDICHQAGLSVGVFYHYFPSKQEALQAIFQRKSTELMELIDTESTARTHLEALLEIFGFICRQQVSDSFTMVCTSFSPSSSPMAPDPKLVELITSIVHSAQLTGELSTQLDAQRITLDLLIASRGFLLYWCESGGSFDILPEQQCYLKRILRAYLGPNGKID